MTRARFETPDGEDIDIDSDDVVWLAGAEEEGTTIIELDDGDESSCLEPGSR